MTDTNSGTTTATPEHTIERRVGRDRPRIPHTIHLKEYRMPDGRALLVDRRALAFAAEAKTGDFGGQQVTILAFRNQTKGCPVLASYEEVKTWWYGGANGRNS